MSPNASRDGRANNRSLPEAEIANAPAMLAGLAALPFGEVSYAAPTIRRGRPGHFPDAALAGSSHHAILPNPRAIGRWPGAFAVIDGDEQRIFEHIARTWLAAIGPDREYDRTEISIEPAPAARSPSSASSSASPAGGRPWRLKGEGGRRERRKRQPPCPPGPTARRGRSSRPA